jgi:hypothetical protein
MNINASGRSALIVAAGIWIWCSAPLQAQEATTRAAAPVTAQQPQQPNPLQQLFGVKPTPAAAEQPAPSEVGKPVALNKYTKRRSHHRKRRASSHSRKYEKPAKTTKASDREKNSKTADASNNTVPAAKTSAPAPLSASVANAKAQLIDPNSTSDAVATMTPVQHSSPAPTETATTPPAAGTLAANSSSTAESGVVPSDELNEVDRALSENPKPTPTLALASINSPSPTAGQAVTAGEDGSSWAQASLIGKIFIAFGGLLTLASAARMLIA